MAGGAAAQSPLAGFDPADFGKVVIQPRQSTSGAGGIAFEQAFGNYQNEPVIAYGEGSQAVRLGRPVGRLDMLFEDGSTGFCTAFIVDDTHLLTNYHCIPGLPRDGVQPQVKAAQFVAGYIRPGHGEGVDRYTVAPNAVEADRALDYAVLEVFGDPSQTYGRLELAGVDPEDGEFLWIIGHPQGQSQHISREGCAASSPAVSGEGKLMHTCDTLGGNSGSPVLRLSDKRVVALHHAGDSRTGYNMAIPMARILAVSKVLKGAEGLPAAAPAPLPEVSGGACDALWTEAKEQGCAGYGAYLASCGTHAFAGLARNLQASDCGTAAPAISNGALTVKPSGGDFPTLAEAVQRAPDGARISVWPGVYSGPVYVSKDVEITGAGPRDQIIIDGVMHWSQGRGAVRGLTLRQGVAVDGGSLTLEDNVITSPATGIALRGGDAVVRANLVQQTGETGVSISSNGAVRVEVNRITRSAHAGIEIRDGAAPEVFDNEISDGAQSGVYLHSGGGGVLRGNEIHHNAFHAISAKGAVKPVVRGNRLHSNGYDAVRLREGAGGTWEDNDLSGNRAGGFRVEPDAGNVLLRGNRE